jgi:hypothetical protein
VFNPSCCVNDDVSVIALVTTFDYGTCQTETEAIAKSTIQDIYAHTFNWGVVFVCFNLLSVYISNFKHAIPIRTSMELHEERQFILIKSVYICLFLSKSLPY